MITSCPLSGDDFDDDGDDGLIMMIMMIIGDWLMIIMIMMRAKEKHTKIISSGLFPIILREAIVYQIGCFFFTHCGRGGGGEVRTHM